MSLLIYFIVFESESTLVSVFNGFQCCSKTFLWLSISFLLVLEVCLTESKMLLKAFALDSYSLGNVFTRFTSVSRDV